MSDTPPQLQHDLYNTTLWPSVVETSALTRVKEPSVTTPPRERNHRRSFDGSPSQETSPVSEGRRRRGRRSTESIVKAPLLETVVGSPPDSPKANAQSAITASFTSPDDAIPSFISSEQSLASRSSSPADTTSRFGPAPDTPKSKLAYPRIDDDGALNDVPESFDWPSTLRRTQRSVSSAYLFGELCAHIYVLQS